MGVYDATKFHEIKTNEREIEKYKVQYPKLSHVRCDKENEGIILDNNGAFVAIIQWDNKSKYIVALEVAPEYRKNGIGKYLLKKAYSKGINKLSVNKSNTSAIKLYIKSGYKEEKTDKTMIYMIKESTINENYFFSGDDIVLNIEKWKADSPNNILYVTGLSGSGKTTLAAEYEKKYNAEMFEIDGLEYSYDASKSKLLQKAKDKYPEYAEALKNDWKDLKGNPGVDLLIRVLLYVIKEMKDSGKLYILDGVQIFQWLDPDTLKSQPLIIKGTSMTKSIYQRFKRNGGDKIDWIAELRNKFPQLFKRYLKDEKEVSTFKKSIKESYNIGDQFSWETFGGNKYSGIISEIDSNVLIVKLKDGTQKAVEMRESSTADTDDINDWEKNTNSELIGDDSNNLSELEKEKNNYDMLIYKQKRVADWKSEELFGKDNTERYDELKDKYLKTIDNFDDVYNTPQINTEASISSADGFEIDDSKDNEYTKLSDDPNNEVPGYDSATLKQAIMWCNNTMVSMILPVGSLKELEDSYVKWRSMTRKHQRDSDNKSIELFGMNNLEHFDYLKSKFIGTQSSGDKSYDTTSVLDVSGKAIEIDQIRDDLTANGNTNGNANGDMHESSMLDYGISLLRINNIITEDICSNIVKENAIKDIKNKLNNAYDKSYDSLPTQLPYFSFNEIQSRIDTSNPYKYAGLSKDISLKTWLESYSLICSGILDSRMKEYTPLWITKLDSLYRDLYKATDDTKIHQLKENILLLGWNPEVNFTYENRIKATDRCMSIISEYYKDNSINLSPLINNINLNNNVITEQNKKDELYPIYILLSYTSTIAGKVISRVTDSIYSHACLSLDSSLQKLYSFNANVHGFSLESITEYLKYNKNSIIQLSCVFVKAPDLSIIESGLNDLLLNIRNTSYSFLNILGIMLDKSIQLNNSMICSKFVDYMFKSINVDITNKPSGLVMPKDFQVLKNNKVYKLYEGKIADYNSQKINSMMNVLIKKAIYIKESLNIINESQFIDTLSKNSNDINIIAYLNQSHDILEASNQLIYNDYIDPYINISCMTESKEFPVQFDKDGNLLIRNKKNIDFEVEYSKAHKLLKIYDSTDNTEGMKYELSKLWFLNLLLEDMIYTQKNKDPEYLKVRARSLNDFNKYIIVVSKQDKDFNFTEYYNNTPFSDETTKINSSTLKYTGEILEKILKHLIH